MYGVRPGGLNPVCGAELWRAVGLPRMLYGAELWGGISKTDMEKLEITHKFAVKRIQGFSPTTRTEAAIGSLGFWTAEGYIDKTKLLFFHKLLSSPSTSIRKIVFIKSLFSYLYRLSNMSLGFIPDIIRILHKYEFDNGLKTPH